MKPSRSAVLGCLGAGALTFAALLAVAYPSALVRAALALLTPVVVALAFVGAWHDGRCPSCRARRALQDSRELAPVVSVASRADGRSADVMVDLGWEVMTGVHVTCRACRHDYVSRNVTFVSRTDARTASEALIWARQPQRPSR